MVALSLPSNGNTYKHCLRFRFGAKIFETILYVVFLILLSKFNLCPGSGSHGCIIKMSHICNCNQTIKMLQKTMDVFSIYDLFRNHQI